ncbi:major capsid protein, partial [Lactococcus petauri]|uniref:major capsid protein n=1 Tax=Lactococcus petauri TaxID=1940789 RepID=UPI0021F17D8A
SLNRDMIIRAIRKQQADVLQTGIVTLNNGDNIDYKRLPSSMVNVSTGGVYWGTAATATPITDIRKGMDFLRNIGNSGGA